MTLLDKYDKIYKLFWPLLNRITCVFSLSLNCRNTWYANSLHIFRKKFNVLAIIYSRAWQTVCKRSDKYFRHCWPLLFVAATQLCGYGTTTQLCCYGTKAAIDSKSANGRKYSNKVLFVETGTATDLVFRL